MADEIRVPRRSRATRKLVMHRTLADNPSEVFVVRFSPDGKLVATGCNDGAIRVYNLRTGYVHNLNVGVHNMPTTSLRFRPISAASKTKNVLLAVNADGSAQHWHITSGKCLHTISDPDNQLFCVDYRPDGALFATAGKDRSVRVYDEATKSLVTKMSGGIPNVTAGHSNRVFSLKFVPDDENLLVSGGWDNTVQVWDIRAGHSVRSIFGPHVAGDSVDCANGVVLTGSWRPEECLQTWDLASCELIETIEWQQSALKGEGTALYAAQFSKDTSHSLIAAGGSNANVAKVFDRSAGNAIVGSIAGLSRGVFSMDWYQDKLLAVAGGDCAVRLFSVETIDDERKGDEEAPVLMATPDRTSRGGGGGGDGSGGGDGGKADEGEEENKAGGAPEEGKYDGNDESKK